MFISSLLFISSLFLPPANEVCEGYVFIGVCLSTGGGGGMHGGGGGICGCGGCAWLEGGINGCGGGMHGIRRDTVNERAVRILLECILVNINIVTKISH